MTRMSSTPSLVFAEGFQGKRQFRERWRQVEDEDDPGPLLKEMFLMPNCPLERSLVHRILSCTFTRYCNSFDHRKIASVLGVPELREVIEKLNFNCIPSLLKNVTRTQWNQQSEKQVEECSDTLLVLLQNETFSENLNEFDFQSAMNIPRIKKQVIDTLITKAYEGVFVLSESTKLLAEDNIQQNPNSLHFQEISKAVLAACEEFSTRKVFGYSENTNVIKDRINCRRKFPSPFYRGSAGEGVYPLTSLELAFNSLSGLIRRKDNWRDECTDDNIVDKWREELKGRYRNCKLFDLVVEQLRLLRLIGLGKNFEVSPVNGVLQSDVISTETLKTKFEESALFLQNSTRIDYHPGSNNLIADIVDPSLYPAVSGLTRIALAPAMSVDSSYKSNLGNLGLPVFNFPKNKGKEYGLSKKFSWIPSEFEVSEDGKVSTRSYINNLHPKKFPDMYVWIEQIFSAALPMIEQVLSMSLLDYNKVSRFRLIPDPEVYPLYDSLDATESEEHNGNKNRIPLQIPLPEHFPAEHIQHYVQSKVSLRSKQLQAIVKISNIELTPQHPVYPGGSWQVEGMKNEDIVCTLLHYYSCDNISESNLQFRQAIREPTYQQCDIVGAESRFGLHEGDALHQELGCITAKEGRTVVFPNHYQQCISPFQLLDVTRPGHRKVLVIFLVNPLHRIISTSCIPPQSRQWAAHEPQSQLHEVFHQLGLSADLVAFIFTFLEFPIDIYLADTLRSQLKQERSLFTDELTQHTFERHFQCFE